MDKGRVPIHTDPSGSSWLWENPMREGFSTPTGVELVDNKSPRRFEKADPFALTKMSKRKGGHRNP